MPSHTNAIPPTRGGRSPQQAPRLLVIRPPRWIEPVDLAEVWRYRELLLFLVWRDLKVRYKQAVLGGVWAILQPLLAAVIFSLVFGVLAKMPSDGAPYFLFAYVGLLPWQIFATALHESTNSVVVNQQIIQRIYFPRVFIPLAPVVASLVDFCLAFVVLLLMMQVLGVDWRVRLVAVPALVLIAQLAALGVGLWTAALNVRYRDIRHAVPFLVQIWFFATPIVYSSSLVPARWRPWLGLNPIVGVVEGFRWAVLGSEAPEPAMVVTSVASITLVLVSGALYFRHAESSMADIV